MNEKDGEVLEHIDPVNKELVLTDFLDLEILNELDIDFNQLQKQVLVDRVETLQDKSDGLQGGLDVHLFVILVLENYLPYTHHFQNSIDYFHGQLLLVLLIQLHEHQKHVLVELDVTENHLPFKREVDVLQLTGVSFMVILKVTDIEIERNAGQVQFDGVLEIL